MNAVFKFLSEFAHNRAQRISFKAHSANGVLLFRELANAVAAFAAANPHVVNPGAANSCGSGGGAGGAAGGAGGGDGSVGDGGGGGPDVYKDRYKGMAQAGRVLCWALSGGYANLGVFALYGDPALRRALDAAVQLVKAVPIEHVLAYAKVHSPKTHKLASTSYF